MKQIKSDWLKNSLISVAKIQLAFAVIYIAQIIAFDASKLITPEVLLWRWVAAAGLVIVSIFVLYMARGVVLRPNHYKLLTWVVILTDIAFAAFNVYTQRGMSSRSVALFFIPIIISAILFSRIALFTTAILCAAVYTTTAIAYFVNYFNEGYKIELYGEILFYSGLFIVAASLIWAAIRTSRQT